MWSADKLTISPPTIKDFSVPEQRLCGPGPVNVLPSVYRSYLNPVLWPGSDQNRQVLTDIKAGLQYAFQTESKLLLAISGSGNAAMETLILNLLAPGETLLIANRGIWDERASLIAKRHGVKTVEHKAPLGGTFDVKDLEILIKRIRPTALFMTHGDSSTGTVQNLIGLGDICHKYNCLLLVDTVVTLAAEPFFMDKWGIDAVYTSTQKAFSGPAGISPVAFSALAEQKIRNRKHDPPFYFDIKFLADQWDCDGKDSRHYHHTMSPPLLWALRCCLQEVCKETLPVAWARHKETMLRFHHRLQQLPVTFLVPKPEDRLNTVTTVVLPKGYEHKAFNKFVRENHHIVIFGGLGPTVNKALRIGLMGMNATTQIADEVADAIADALKATAKL